MHIGPLVMKSHDVPAHILRMALRENRALGLGLSKEDIINGFVHAQDNDLPLLKYWQSIKNDILSGED